MPAALPVPRLRRDGAPVSLLIDYDGTISRRDTLDFLLKRFATNAETVAALDRAYDEGRVGSRALMEWDMAALPADPDAVRAAVAEIPLDEGIVPLVEAVEAAGGAVEIVSDGLGFYIAPNLERLGLGHVPVATNDGRLGPDERRIDFPYGHPRCFVCGTCKRERVRAHQDAGNVVVFVGDGTSDRFAAAHAEVVFAKESLARICRAEGWPFQHWHDLHQVADRLAAALADGSLVRTRRELPDWRARYAPAPRPFICGPEVWGPDRSLPIRG